MTTNSEVELEIAKSVSGILQKAGVRYQCDVHLHRGDRKKRRDAEFQPNWNPDTDLVRIAFSPMEEDDGVANDAGMSAAEVGRAEPSHDRLLDLIHALDRAESRPGYEFVALKWFRDTALVREGFSWVADAAARQDVLHEAIERQWIKTRKVANPRPPNFPVTAIQVNRLMPEVNAALGGPFNGPPAFHPVRIRGEALSATVLHDRR